MISKKLYYKLLEKYLSGKCSDEELEVLRSKNDDIRLKEVEWDEDLMGDREKIRQQIDQRVKASIKRGARVTYLKYLSVAAILIALFISGYLFYNTKSSKFLNTQNAGVTFKKEDFSPASDIAVLIINNKINIPLSSIDSQRVVLFNGDSIGTISGNQIELNYAANHLIYTISTPKAGKFKILLPDHTSVWLNSGSKISLMTSEFKRHRRLDLSGEAYFEVAKNKKLPFTVKVRSSEITVLGTHFNIKANSSDQSVKTTLFEGSIAIKNGNTTKVLKPGQEAITKQSPLNSKEDVVINDVDLDKKAGWKKGYFIFDKANIKEVMEELSNWYNVEVEYQGAPNADLFKGKIRNDLNLTEVLGILELNGVHFELRDNKILVLP